MSGLIGDPYYVASAAPRYLPKSRAEERLRNVLAEETRDVVSETVKRWNAPLRAEVRAVTALKLPDEFGRPSVTIHVAVTDGMPKPLADQTNDFTEWQWWLVLQRRSLKQAIEGLDLLVKNKDMLAKGLDNLEMPFDSVSTSRIFIERILKHSVENRSVRSVQENRRGRAGSVLDTRITDSDILDAFSNFRAAARCLDIIVDNHYALP